MARSIKESEQAITSALSAIETSLANKEVSASNLKVSEVADKIREIELGPKGVFGFKVNNLESDPTNRVTYIDDNKKMTPVTVNLSDGSVDYGDWKDTWLLEKIYPVMLKTNGTIAYKLDPNDQTKKASGGTSDINNMDYDGNAMVIFEKFYTKFSSDSTYYTVEFSKEKREGFEALGFTKEDGTEVDWIAMSMFIGSKKDGDSKLRSIGDQVPFGYQFYRYLKEAVDAAGDGYNMDTYVMTQIFSALLILLLKSCDHQKKLGEGRNIETYPGQQKTGILSNKGAIAYDPETKATKFLWREDISSRFQRYVDGIQTKLYKTSVKMTLPDASDPSAETNWVQMREESSTTTSGYIQTMLCDNKYGRFFNKLGGSEDTYETAKWHSVHGKDSTVYHYMSYDYDGPSGYGEDVNSSTRSYSLGVSLTYFPKS